MSDSDRYHGVAIALHWLTALAVLCLFVIGLVMTDLPRGASLKFTLYQLHKSVGITVLLLTVVRFGWRLTHRPPALPDHIRNWERRASEAMHAALYVFLFGLPMLGWATVSASPYNLPTILYGVVPWPHLPVLSTLANKAAAEELLGDLHSSGAWVMLAFLALHAGAAIRHHLILHDDILLRMLPRALHFSRRSS